MKQIFRTVIILIGTLGWWGFVYPDLCLTPDESTVQEEEICIKSRLYEYVCQVREKG